MCCLGIWWCSEGPKCPNSQSPSPLCSHGWGSLAKQLVLLDRPGTVLAYHSAAVSGSLPACRITGTNQSHLPVGPRGHHSLWTRQNLPPTDPTAHPGPEWNPVWPCKVRPLPQNEYRWLINYPLSRLSGVSSYVLSHPHSLRMVITPSAMVWRRGDQNKDLPKVT